MCINKVFIINCVFSKIFKYILGSGPVIVFTDGLYAAFLRLSVFERRTARWQIGQPRFWQSSEKLQHFKEKPQNLTNTLYLTIFLFQEKKRDKFIVALATDNLISDSGWAARTDRVSWGRGRC